LVFPRNRTLDLSNLRRQSNHSAKSAVQGTATRGGGGVSSSTSRWRRRGRGVKHQHISLSWLLEYVVTIRPRRGESPKDVVIFYKKRFISPVLVLLLVGVFEPKRPFGLGHWGTFLYNVHIAIFHPRMHIAYCNMNMGIQFGYFFSK
jgi:hypothetical protein